MFVVQKGKAGGVQAANKDKGKHDDDDEDEETSEGSGQGKDTDKDKEEGYHPAVIIGLDKNKVSGGSC